jgi:triosephosphate isomerase
MILVNFKIYKESFGDEALKLASICKKVAENSGIEIIPVVSALDAYRIKNEIGIKVYLQHVDNYLNGAHTGFTSPIQAQTLGIEGCLLNHSEHKLKPGTTLATLKNLPTGFKSVVCLSSIGQAETWAKNIKPDFIAYEPSYLIGNKEKSVATEKPEIIKKMVEKFKDIPVLAGAGIKSAEDVKISLNMGAKGILIASSIVTAKDPECELINLTKAFNI